MTLLPESELLLLKYTMYEGTETDIFKSYSKYYYQWLILLNIHETVSGAKKNMSERDNNWRESYHFCALHTS